jgi:hypothetical protein
MVGHVHFLICGNSIISFSFTFAHLNPLLCFICYMLCFYLLGTVPSHHQQEQLLGGAERPRATLNSMARETELLAPEEEAPMKQVAPEEHKACDGAPEDQEGSSSEDDDKEGARHRGETSSRSNRSTTC